MMKKKVLFGILCGSFLLFQSNLVGASQCSSEEAKRYLERMQKFHNLPNLQIEINSVSKIEDLDLCEVVFTFKPEFRGLDNEKKREERPPLQKNIMYYKGKYLFFGELKKVEDDKIVEITKNKILALNKEFYEYLSKKTKENQKQEREESNRIREEIKREYSNLEKLADIRFKAKKDGKPSIFLFIDPYCPYCKDMKEKVMKKEREGKANVYFIFVPLGEESRKIEASILCDKKTEEEKLKAFDEKYINKERICEEGLKKIDRNTELFKKLGGRGVPFGFVKKGEDIYMIRGAIPENILDSYID